MAVAQLRGVKFVQFAGGNWQPELPYVDKAHAALKDVYNWLSYDDADEYLGGMMELGKDIFNRAKY